MTRIKGITDSFTRRGHYWLSQLWFWFSTVASFFSTVASFPILLLVYSALARYLGYWSLLNSNDHAGCLKSDIRIILEWIEMWHWRNNQCYILWEPRMRKVRTTLVFDPTVRAVLSHCWTDAVADAAAVSPVAQRWRGIRTRGQRRDGSHDPRAGRLSGHGWDHWLWGWRLH